MKKWPIIALMAVLLAAYGIFLLFWFGQERPAPEPPAVSTQALSQPQVIPVVDTEPAETEPSVTAETDDPALMTQPAEPVLPPDETLLRAKHVFVYDLTNERLMYTMGDQQEQIAPASLTKLFTIYVALRHLEADAVVTVGEEVTWIEKDSSVAAVKEGNRLTVEMLVQGMMMQSGNDAAYALAVAAGRQIAGDPEMSARDALAAFMDEMNLQARELGLVDSYFVTPDGYDAVGHRTTAENLMRIALLVLKEPMIVRFAAMPQAVVTFASGENYTWKNTNWMMREEEHPELYCPEVTGLKTGGTSKAGKCIIATFDDGERQLLIGVLGCEEIEERFEDALYLYDHFRYQ
jgi:D-alanyl-D-alanine carboxypeptidase (penicillin-binding protein 5/6)